MRASETHRALARYEGKDIVLDCTGEDYEEMLSKLDGEWFHCLIRNFL